MQQRSAEIKTTIKIKFMICLILIVPLTTGCWDAMDVEDRDICTLIIADKTDAGYSFYVEIIGVTSTVSNVQTDLPNQPQKPEIISVEGKTITEARAELENRLSKPIFLGSTQAVLFTDNMARSGIEEYAYRMRENNDYRKIIDVAVVSGNPAEFSHIAPENSTTLGFAIENTIQTQIDYGHTFHFTIADLLEKLSSQNKAYICTDLKNKENDLASNGYCVFDGGKSVGYIPMDEVKGVVYLYPYSQSTNGPRFNYLVPYNDNNITDDNNITVEARLSDRDIHAAYDHGRITFNVKCGFDAMIMYSSKGEPISRDAEKQVASELKDMLTKDIANAIDTSQKEFALDYLSFSEPFRIRYPDEYKKMDWKQQFPHAAFNVEVTVKLSTDKVFDYDQDKQ